LLTFSGDSDSILRLRCCFLYAAMKLLDPSRRINASVKRDPVQFSEN